MSCVLSTVLVILRRRWKFSTGRMKWGLSRGKSNILWCTEAITNYGKIGKGFLEVAFELDFI